MCERQKGVRALGRPRGERSGTQESKETEQPASDAGGKPREGHLKCLKSLSRSFRKGGRNLNQNARKRARVRPLLFLPLLQEGATGEQEETPGQGKRKRANEDGVPEV